MTYAQAVTTPQAQDEISHQFQLIAQLRKEKKWDELVQLMPGLIKTFTKVPGFHLAYADALREMKRFSEAIENYRAVRELLPDDPLAYDGEGWAFLEAGDFNAAEAAIVKGMKVRPEFHKFLHTSLGKH